MVYTHNRTSGFAFPGVLAPDRDVGLEKVSLVSNLKPSEGLKVKFPTILSDPETR